MLTWFAAKYALHRGAYQHTGRPSQTQQRRRRWKRPSIWTHSLQAHLACQHMCNFAAALIYETRMACACSRYMESIVCMGYHVRAQHAMSCRDSVIEFFEAAVVLCLRPRAHEGLLCRGSQQTRPCVCCGADDTRIRSIITMARRCNIEAHRKAWRRGRGRSKPPARQQPRRELAVAS